jgi:precorrin-6B methylase 2
MGNPPPSKRLREALYEPVEGLPQRKKGLGSGIRAAKRWIMNRLFERGMDTAVHAIELDHFHRDRIWYVPSDWSDLRRAMRGRKVGPADVFVDFGSGKGRMVYQAARFPFGRVIGVEISEKLCEVARENIAARTEKLKCTDVQLVTMDAAEFAVPDDVTYVYFYHPFGGETFKAVVANIVQSLERRPRRLTVIYQTPVLEEHLLATGRFRYARTVKYRCRDPHRMSVYESWAPGSPDVSTG